MQINNSKQNEKYNLFLSIDAKLINLYQAIYFILKKKINKIEMSLTYNNKFLQLIYEKGAP